MECSLLFTYDEPSQVLGVCDVLLVEVECVYFVKSAFFMISAQVAMIECIVLFMWNLVEKLSWGIIYLANAATPFKLFGACKPYCLLPPSLTQ